MSLRSSGCDKGEHDDCLGTVRAFIDQDGPATYNCECHCHEPERRAEKAARRRRELALSIERLCGYVPRAVALEAADAALAVVASGGSEPRGGAR